MAPFKFILAFMALFMLPVLASCSKIKDSAMPFPLAPPVEVQLTEQVLSKGEIDALECTTLVRRMAAQNADILMGSELVSRDDKHGYIYRYKIVHMLKDYDSQNPDDKYKSIWILSITSRDCKNFDTWLSPVNDLSP